MKTIAWTRRAGHALSSRTGLSPLALLSISAIGAVVVFVSLPRLRNFALHENEKDARVTAEFLARTLSRLHTPADARTDPEALVRLSIQELVSDPSVLHALPDAEILQAGRLLRRHGYLFQVVTVPDFEGPRTTAGEVLAAERPSAPQGSTRAVLAWPWKSGHTGSRAILATADGRLFDQTGSPEVQLGARSGASPWSWDGWALR